jgi:F-type H+-transporting ATPase subunit a
MSEGIEEPILIQIPGIPVITTMTWVVVSILIVFASIVRINLSLRPKTAQSLMELVFEFIGNLIKSMIGENGYRFLPLFCTLFLFILVSNLLGLLPGFKSPTSNLNTNVALALIVFFSTHYFGIRKKGVFGYLKHFMGPPYWLAPLFFPIHVIGELARPLSLSMRLFGNIVAKEIVLGVLAYLVTVFYFSADISSKMLTIMPLVLRPAIILLGCLVSFIQALVFTSLAMIYIGGAIASHEEGH